MSDYLPIRKILRERTERDVNGDEVQIVTLECGHEQIGGPPYQQRHCIQCRDEAKYGPAPRPPRESP